MSDNKDIRWLQRLDNYCKAFAKLSLAVEMLREKNVEKL